MPRTSRASRQAANPEAATPPDADPMAPAPPRTYSGEHRAQIAFPIGGIGTGSISIGGWGQLRDFEIFNRPAKGQDCQMAFFSLFAQREGDAAVARVLQGPVAGSRDSAHGIYWQGGAGLPHFADNTFTGAYPFAQLDFTDRKVPLRVRLEAFNPMIPLEADDSSLPAAVFLVHLTNPSRTKPVRATLFANMENLIGLEQRTGNVNQWCDDKALRGLRMGTTGHAPDSPRFGTLALATSWRSVRVQTRWPQLPAFDQMRRFWDQVERGRLDERREKGEPPGGLPHVGSISLSARVRPAQTITLPVVIAWHMPNVEKYWNRVYGIPCACGDDLPTWRNHYATRFDDAWAVAEYTLRNLDRLEGVSRTFADALYGSTLPGAVTDAAGSQMSILKTTTCLRLEDGSFYGWEGCHPTAGCCEGTCSHVWNYAQALPHLYPDLQASAVENHLKHSMLDDGAMVFRMPLPMGTPPKGDFHPAADGQMGIVLNAYRHWRTTGDDAWLERWWPEVRKALEYAWRFWDADHDGVVEGLQHNTYDIEFYGPNTMITSLYLAALRAGEQMARYVGDAELADHYQDLADRGGARCDEMLWWNDYYIQRVDPKAREQAPVQRTIFSDNREDGAAPDEPPHQYGFGCLSDQMIGQWYAHMLDLGYLFEKRKVRKTMKSIVRYNFRRSLAEHVNTHRVYALGDEAGLVMCSWPHGRREAFPFIYAHEVWPGIEYQVATHLVYEGMLREAVAIVAAVRDRHNGYHRNPWNEVECGNHYARSMASWALVPALGGFRWDAPEQRITFAPRVSAERFRTFFVAGSGWGTYAQKIDARGGKATLDVAHGELPLWHVVLDPRGAALSTLKVRQGGRPQRSIPAHRDDRLLEISFDHRVTVRPGKPLEIRWRHA